MNKFFNSIFLTLLFSSNAYSADWYLIENFGQGNLYIDRDSVTPFKNSSVKLRYKVEVQERDGMAVTTILRCKDYAQTIQSFTSYKPNKPRAENIIPEEEQLTAPIQGTYNTAIFNYACKK